MAYTKPCPMCGHENDRKANECGKCAVVFRNVRPAGSGGRDAPESCEYEDLGLRCKYPPTISSGTNGSGRVYCRWHFRERGTPAALDILRTSQSYVEEGELIESIEDLESNAKRIADRFGVDPRLAPADRARAVYRAAMLATRRVAPATREPGED